MEDVVRVFSYTLGPVLDWSGLVYSYESQVVPRRAPNGDLEIQWLSGGGPRGSPVLSPTGARKPEVILQNGRLRAVM